MKSSDNIPFLTKLEIRRAKILNFLKDRDYTPQWQIQESTGYLKFQIISAMRDLQERGEVLRQEKSDDTYWRINNNG